MRSLTVMSARFVLASAAVSRSAGTPRAATLLLTLTAWRPLSNSAELLFAQSITTLAIGTIVALSVPLAAIALLPTGVGVPLGLAILVCAQAAVAHDERVELIAVDQDREQVRS